MRRIAAIIDNTISAGGSFSLLLMPMAHRHDGIYFKRQLRWGYTCPCAPVSIFFARPKKIDEKKRAPTGHSFVVFRRLRNSVGTKHRAALRQSSPTTPKTASLLLNS
jgi:hypothetical protein